MRPDSCFETIRIHEGKAQHLAYHNARFNRTRKILFGKSRPVDLAQYLQDAPPKGLYRAKVIYDEKQVNTNYNIYKAKKITQIRCIESSLTYPYKYLDRREIDLILAQQADCDEVIFTHKGLLTDTSIANIALRCEGVWYTPRSPLLPGTTRARLLDTGRLQTKDIHLSELAAYDGLALMNAMIGFYEVGIDLLYP